jgi:hypothetical protein
MSTPTPRTDAQAGWAIANQYGQSTARELLADPEGAFVHSVFARALETELVTLTAEVKRLKRAYEYDHKCLCEVQDRCELWKQRAQKAEAELAKYLSACPASPTEEERKRCQQWWAVSGKSP